MSGTRTITKFIAVAGIACGLALVSSVSANAGYCGAIGTKRNAPNMCSLLVKVANDRCGEYAACVSQCNQLASNDPKKEFCAGECYEMIGYQGKADGSDCDFIE